MTLFTSGTGFLLPAIIIAAFFATVSYLFYYRAISQIGPSKAMALNVSYSAWAMIFTVIFMHDTSVLSPVNIICALTVLICGILAAADYKELLSS